MTTDTARPGNAPDAEQKENTEADAATGPQQDTRDDRAEVLRQIRLALILDSSLSLEEAPRATGFDPYNSRIAPARGVWRPRRRD